MSLQFPPHPHPVSGTQAGPVSPSLSSQDLLLAKVTHVNIHVLCTHRAKPRNTRGNKEDPGPGPALSLAGPRFRERKQLLGEGCGERCGGGRQKHTPPFRPAPYIHHSSPSWVCTRHQNTFKIALPAWMQNKGQLSEKPYTLQWFESLL